MSVYIIANIKVEDRNEYAKYQEGFMEIFERYKGELLVVADDPQVVEGDWPYTRAVVIRFPSAEEARRWYQSPEYQALSQHRWCGSKGAIVIAEGLA